MTVDLMALLVGMLATVAVGGALAGVAVLRGRGAAVELQRLRGDAGDGSSALKMRPVTPAGANPEDLARSRLRRELVQAGLRRAEAPQLFIAGKAILALAGLSAVLVVNAMRAEPLKMALPLALLGTGAGYFLPSVWLRMRRAERLRRIERAIPDALDLLVTCVEAGLGLDAALQRVADEMALAYPLFSSELRLAFLEVKAGIPRIDALRRLAERTGSTELRSLAATLAQTEMFGTSVAGALRVQADGIRVRRMQRAEEKAAYVAVKMTLPLVVCILPAIFAVVVGPAIVNIAGKLASLAGGR